MEALARQSSTDVAGVLVSCVADGANPEITLVRLLQVQPDVEQLRRTIDRSLSEATAALADAVRRLIDADTDGVRRAAELLVDSQHIVEVARWFDAAVRKSEEASVAVYSLGSAERLESATNEVVALLGRWGVIHAESVILQIGCGIGRFEAALAGRVRRAHGIDVSPGMIEVARRRCRGISNVELELCTGRDFGDFADQSFDLIYAIDSFPYVYEAGGSVVDTHFREARRLLGPRGDFVIFNFSYRGDLGADRRDLERLAKLWGFDLLRNGERPLCTWDGAGFHLRVAD
jgi:ubiquinone/menaquinone biosynthesis C-methylase UbiE